MNRFCFAQPSRVVAVAAFALSCLMIGSALAQLETRSTTGLPGKEPLQVVAADFNGDGKLDLAVTDSSFSILLGNGDGTFQKPINYSYTGLGIPIATADFNGDGKADLVIPNESSGVSVFLGNGDGTFQAPIVSATTAKATFVVVGDFNNDKKADLLIIDYNYVSVLLGNGDGTFQSPIDNDSFPVFPYAAALADFNNDGKLDVAVVGEQGSVGDLGVFLGNGDGTLQSPMVQSTKSFPYSVAAGDFNKDGNIDLAVAEGDIGVFLGNGDGTVQAEVDYGANTGFVQAADMNGDGTLDLVCAGVYELTGNGDGTFQPPRHYPAGRFFWWLLTEDFNGDHKPDVLVSDATLGEISLLNTGVALFSPSTPISFPPQLIGTTSAGKTVKLTNTGTTTMSISAVEISGVFKQTNTCGNSVAPGASCSVSTTFRPTNPGPYSGLIRIVDSASSKPQYIEVFGSATALSLAPTSINFGAEKVATKSPPRKVTILNESTKAVTFKANGIGIGGADSRDFIYTENCGTQLAPGASCTMAVIFQPSKKGLRTADAFFQVTGDGSPAPVALSGTGT